MADSIPVDLYNPGQVFACMGLLEVAEVLFDNIQGGFDWATGRNAIFEISANSSTPLVLEILNFLRDAEISALSPGSEIQERDGGATSYKNGVHPCRIADFKGNVRSALLPICLSDDPRQLQIDSWTDFDSGRDLLQLWTATNGNSAFVRFSKLHAAYKIALSSSITPERDPFNLPAPVAANFRLELRRNWTAINLGFSPDKINKSSGCVPIEMMTYPAVELLAAIGLNHARPSKLRKLEWSYSVWCMPLSPSLARAVIGGDLFPEVCRRFRMILEEPNDGGDLSIANSYEELRARAEITFTNSHCPVARNLT